MQFKELKQVLISIFIGACVAFVSAFAEGLVHALQGYAVPTAAGVATTLTHYLYRA